MSPHNCTDPDFARELLIGDRDMADPNWTADDLRILAKHRQQERAIRRQSRRAVHWPAAHQPKETEKA